MNLKCFGSEYGHWCFIDNESLKNSLVISGGVGEDMSFDVDFASEYNATVVLYDPTPRAVQHFDELSKNLGKSSTMEYVSGGNQPMETYDLSNLKSENFIYNKLALWNDNTVVKFYKPSNPNYVSHSITNYSRNYNKNDSNYIEVNTIKLSDEIKKFNQFPSILKLDIEASALEVIQDLFDNNVYINQICLEYDEHQTPGFESNRRIDMMNSLFDKNNYKLVHQDGYNYLLVRKNFLDNLKEK